VASIEADRGPRFNTSFFTIEMVIAGMGVALAQDVLVADDLAVGRVIRPFRTAVSTPLAYFLVCPIGSFRNPKVAAMREWLREEMNRSSICLQYAETATIGTAQDCRFGPLESKS
jgi:LysR family glycine cleavage system transcriptional activator